MPNTLVLFASQAEMNHAYLPARRQGAEIARVAKCALVALHVKDETGGEVEARGKRLSLSGVIAQARFHFAAHVFAVFLRLVRFKDFKQGVRRIAHEAQFPRFAPRARRAAEPQSVNGRFRWSHARENFRRRFAVPVSKSGKKRERFGAQQRAAKLPAVFDVKPCDLPRLLDLIHSCCACYQLPIRFAVAPSRASRFLILTLIKPGVDG